MANPLVVNTIESFSLAGMLATPKFDFVRDLRELPPYAGDNEELDANFGLLTRLGEKVDLLANPKIKGIIASYKPLEPETIFWGLKENYWKQVIDGKHWFWGPMVYDKGLHYPNNPKVKEPGYLDGMYRGGFLITQQISQPLTVPFYKLLHKTCWSNEEGPSSYMKRAEAGTFRQNFVHWGASAEDFFNVAPADQARINAAFPEGSQKEIMALVEKSDPEFLKLLQVKIDALIAEIEKMNRLLGLPVGKSIVFLYNTYKIIFINCPKDLDLETLASKLFEHYEKALELAPTLFEKIECILFHYTMCEDIHFFRDGQGRTDRLLFLCGQLCRVGCNPALLDDPYRACTWPFAHALTHLLNGIHAWQVECAQVHGW